MTISVFFDDLEVLQSMIFGKIELNSKQKLLIVKNVQNRKMKKKITLHCQINTVFIFQKTDPIFNGILPHNYVNLLSTDSLSWIPAYDTEIKNMTNQAILLTRELSALTMKPRPWIDVVSQNSFRVLSNIMDP